jgi:hypothetical protein
MCLVYQKVFLLANKVHVPCQLAGKPISQQGTCAFLTGISSFWPTRYMYLSNWKVFLLVNKAEKRAIPSHLHLLCFEYLGIPSQRNTVMIRSFPKIHPPEISIRAHKPYIFSIAQ